MDAKSSIWLFDQHTKLTPGKTIRDVLKDAFLPLLELEANDGHYGSDG